MREPSHVTHDAKVFHTIECNNKTVNGGNPMGAVWWQSTE